MQICVLFTTLEKSRVRSDGYLKVLMRVPSLLLAHISVIYQHKEMNACWDFTADLIIPFCWAEDVNILAPSAEWDQYSMIIYIIHDEVTEQVFFITILLFESLMRTSEQKYGFDCALHLCFYQKQGTTAICERANHTYNMQSIYCTKHCSHLLIWQFLYLLMYQITSVLNTE